MTIFAVNYWYAGVSPAAKSQVRHLRTNANK